AATARLERVMLRAAASRTQSTRWVRSGRPVTGSSDSDGARRRRPSIRGPSSCPPDAVAMALLRAPPDPGQPGPGVGAGARWPRPGREPARTADGTGVAGADRRPGPTRVTRRRRAVAGPWPAAGPAPSR